MKDKFYQSVEIKELDKGEPIFVEVLVNGVVSLYKDPSAFYIAKGDTTLYSLIITEEHEIVNGKYVNRKSNRHIGILSYMMQDCEKVQAKIKRASVDEKFLTGLVEEYNSCISASFVSYKESKPWVKANFGATAGYRISKPTFFSNGSRFAYLEHSKFEGRDMTVGALMESFSPRINERLAFHVRILFCNATYAAYSERKTMFGVYVNDVTFSIKELYIPFGIQYKFFEKAYAPFINAGLFNTTIHLQTDFLRILEYQEKDNVSRRESKEFPFSKSRLGVWGGLGVERKVASKLKAFTEFRYEHSSGFSNPFYLNSPKRSRITSFYLSTGVKF